MAGWGIWRLDKTVLRGDDTSTDGKAYRAVPRGQEEQQLHELLALNERFAPRHLAHSAQRVLHNAHDGPVGLRRQNVLVHHHVLGDLMV